MKCCVFVRLFWASGTFFPCITSFFHVKKLIIPHMKRIKRIQLTITPAIPRMTCQGSSTPPPMDFNSALQDMWVTTSRGIAVTSKKVFIIDNSSFHDSCKHNENPPRYDDHKTSNIHTVKIYLSMKFGHKNHVHYIILHMVFV